MIRLVICPTMLLFFWTSAWGQPKYVDVGMVTGSATGTYIQFGKAIAEVAREPNSLNIIVKESEGSLANIRRMLSSENASLGIVQSDVLGFLSSSTDPEMQRIAKRLRLIFSFYNEEVHLFANRSIQSLEDLKSKRVVVGTQGSGNWLTAKNILHIANVKPSERIELSPEDAVIAVLTGKAEAMFYVAGKPVKLFTRLDDMKAVEKYKDLVKNVHFVPLQSQSILKEYESSTILQNDYEWLGERVETVAVKAVLISYDFSSRVGEYYQTRCRQLAQIGKAVRDNLDSLKQTGHPKWLEVDLDKDIGFWKKDNCSAQFALPSSGQGREEAIQNELRRILTQ